MLRPRFLCSFDGKGDAPLTQTAGDDVGVVSRACPDRSVAASVAWRWRRRWGVVAIIGRRRVEMGAPRMRAMPVPVRAPSVMPTTMPPAMPTISLPFVRRGNNPSSGPGRGRREEQIPRRRRCASHPPERGLSFSGLDPSAAGARRECGTGATINVIGQALCFHSLLRDALNAQLPDHMPAIASLPEKARHHEDQQNDDKEDTNVEVDSDCSVKARCLYNDDSHQQRDD